ncbi:hypothetical protein BDQ17DRAFT_840993 [Cyathus striatus]|nr:hypothetical protein BDQ17DRAFT_840993 [Cyathus striatus]
MYVRCLDLALAHLYDLPLNVALAEPIAANSSYIVEFPIIDWKCQYELVYSTVESSWRVDDDQTDDSDYIPDSNCTDDVDYTDEEDCVTMFPSRLQKELSDEFYDSGGKGLRPVSFPTALEIHRKAGRVGKNIVL